MQLINEYLDCLDIAAKNLEAEIEADPELKQINDAIKFMDSVREGKTVQE